MRTPMHTCFVTGGRAIVCASMLVAAANTADAQELPQDDDWVELRCGDRASFDPRRDGPEIRGAVDVVGDEQAPALFAAFDDEFLYFRMRLDGDPRDPEATEEEPPLQPFGWAVELDHDYDRRSYETITLVDGTRPVQEVRLSQNTQYQLPNDPADVPEELLATFPLMTHMRVALAEQDFESNFGGDADYFVDLAVPLAELLVSGLSPVDPLSVVMGTSFNGLSIDGDVACHDGNGGRASWYAASSGAFRADGQFVSDRDGDGLTDQEEAELGTDPDSSDSDGDGTGDFVEVSIGTDPTSSDDGAVARDRLALRGGGGPTGCALSSPATRGGPFSGALVLFSMLCLYRRARRARRRAGAPA